MTVVHTEKKHAQASLLLLDVRCYGTYTVKELVWLAISHETMQCRGTHGCFSVHRHTTPHLNPTMCTHQPTCEPNNSTTGSKNACKAITLPRGELFLNCWNSTASSTHHQHQQYSLANATSPPISKERHFRRHHWKTCHYDEHPITAGGNQQHTVHHRPMILKLVL
jgi:hypothetical protein